MAKSLATIPGTGANNAAVGTIAWGTPTNITTNVLTNFATLLGSGVAVSNYLQGSNFGFNIPSGASILGIVLTINGRRAATGAGQIKDNSVRLVHSGGGLSANDYVSGISYVAGNTAQIYGTALTDLWGDTWTATDINSSGFGFVLNVTGVSGTNTRTAEISVCTITVYYGNYVALLEPGGDSDFSLGKFMSNNGATIVSDFLHGTHQKSIRYSPNIASQEQSAIGVVADPGSRISVYIYLVAYPTISAQILQVRQLDAMTTCWSVSLTTSGVLQLSGTSAQIGSNGSTLSLGQWYRISVAYTITSGAVYSISLYKNGVLDISGSNSPAIGTATSVFVIGNLNLDTTLDFRSSDRYIDNLPSSTSDIASDVWVTAKRPVSNGTTNGFTTRIGAGGSGYGSGHSPQVNERPLSATNGWSAVISGTAATEEYTIEAASVGDIDTSSGTILGVLGWVSASALAAENASMIIAGNTTQVPLTSTQTTFFNAGVVNTYPAGGTDIGLTTTTASTTVSLYEAGMMIAYTPGVPQPPVAESYTKFQAVKRAAFF